LRTRRPVLVAVALFGLLIGFLVALVIGTAPGGHPVAVAWTIQVLVLVGAVFLLAGRRRRRS
jgi:lipopolysaccharide export LptBFGC system permease protein LptF